MERITVAGAAKMVLEMTEHPAKIKYLTDMPTGPLNRVADNALARKLLDWEPKVMFEDGLKRTIDWYYADRNIEEVETLLQGGGFISRQLES
jgi:nucleoside-diphosphate-sugar epimerase